MDTSLLTYWTIKNGTFIKAINFKDTIYLMPFEYIAHNNHYAQ